MWIMNVCVMDVELGGEWIDWKDPDVTLIWVSVDPPFPFFSVPSLDLIRM